MINPTENNCDNSQKNSLSGYEKRSAIAGRFFYIPHSQNPAIYDRIIAVVRSPDFYYVLTTFHVPGLPRFAAFCLFCDKINELRAKIIAGKLRQIGAEYSFLGGFSFMIKILFVCHSVNSFSTYRLQQIHFAL